MSDVMLFGVLRMPYEMAMSCALSRCQFYARAQEAADRIESLDAEVERLRAELSTRCRADGGDTIGTLDRWTGHEIMNDPSLDCVQFVKLEDAKLATPAAEAVEKDVARYRWLANRVLASDYGDNDSAFEKIGWRIRYDLMSKGGVRQPAFMYGKSIDEAIDAAIDEAIDAAITASAKAGKEQG